MSDNWQESWDRMEEAERRNRDIGEYRQQEAESLVEAARERKAMTDVELMREALKTLELLVEEFATSTRGRCMNCGLMHCPRGCEFLPARDAITKLEERLLKE